MLVDVLISVTASVPREPAANLQGGGENGVWLRSPLGTCASILCLAPPAVDLPLLLVRSVT